MSFVRTNFHLLNLQKLFSAFFFSKKSLRSIETISEKAFFSPIRPAPDVVAIKEAGSPCDL